MTGISVWQLALCLVPVLGVLWLDFTWRGGARDLGVAVLRMVAQLLAIGFVLVFLFGAASPLVGLGVIGVMIAVSSSIAIRVVKEKRGRAFRHALIALGIGGTAVLAFVLFGVLQLSDPLYQPRVMIPIAGMIYSNAMTAVTLAGERLETELANGREFSQARAAAWAAALIPQVNALLAVGLVSLPGMMTGQILSGVEPLIAVRYQIVVMAMVLQSAGYSVAIYLWLSGRSRARP